MKTLRGLASRLGYDFDLLGPSLSVLTLRLTNVCLEFVCGWVLIRTFGTSAYGTYAWVLALVAVLVIPAAAGFDRLLIRETAALVAQQQWGLLRGAIARARQIVATTSGTVAVLAAVAVTFVGTGGILTGELPALILGIALVPILAFNRVRLGLLQGLGKVVLGLVPEMILQPAAILLLTGIILAVGLVRSHPADILTVHLLAAAAIAIYGRTLLRRHLPVEATEAAPVFATRYWILAAAPLAWMLGMNVLMTSIDTILVGIYSGSEHAAVYRITSQLAMLTALPLTAVNTVLAPKISRLYVRKEVDSLQSVTTRAAGAILLMATAVCLATYLLGEQVLTMFGPEFASGRDALLVLSLGYLFNAAMGPTGYLLVMTRYQAAAAAVFTAVTVLNAAGGMMLIPRFGLSGAAASTAASMVVLSATFAWLVRRHLGICSTALPFRPAGFLR